MLSVYIPSLSGPPSLGPSLRTLSAISPCLTLSPRAPPLLGTLLSGPRSVSISLYSPFISLATGLPLTEQMHASRHARRCIRQHCPRLSIAIRTTTATTIAHAPATTDRTGPLLEGLEEGAQMEGVESGEGTGMAE